MLLQKVVPFNLIVQLSVQSLISLQVGLDIGDKLLLTLFHLLLHLPCLLEQSFFLVNLAIEVHNCISMSCLDSLLLLGYIFDHLL